MIRRKSIFDNPAEIIPFHLPHDLADGFFFWGWRRPELYLDKNFCNGISSLTKLPSAMLVSDMEKLRQDISSGKWHEKYGYMLNLSNYDCGYRFVVVAKKS